MSFLVFAMHTAPDVKTAASFHDLGDLDDKSALKAIGHINQQSGNQRIPLYWQKIVAISCVSSGENMELDINRFGSNEVDESTLLTSFVHSITSRTQVFVSWNARAREYPLLMYRCLKNEISAPGLFTAEPVTLVEKVANPEQHDMISQGKITSMLGLKKLPEMSEKEIWRAWLEGEKERIQNDCTLSAIETYHIYLRYRMVIGAVSKQFYEQEYARMQNVAMQLPA